ncbi:MAG TPA: hypothetical protein VNU01_08745 [Egibacteraceae bacterium]|nr:hypothetical protein [Egibacteraceae bacterium]
MSKRLLGVVLLAVLAVAGLAGPVAAVEEGDHGPVRHELPSIDEVGSQSDTAREFFPPEYEQPPVFPWFGWPLLIGGLVLTLWVMLSYLVFQPRFAKERKAKAARKR